MIDTVPFDMHCYSLDWHPKAGGSVHGPKYSKGDSFTEFGNLWPIKDSELVI
jgi:hypothetical protein